MRIGLLLGESHRAQEWSVLFNPESPMPTNYAYYDFNASFLYTVGFDRLTLVRYWLWAKEYVQARRSLERWLEAYRESKRLAELIEALICLAVANYYLGRLDAAVSTLLEAIGLAQPDRYVQMFRNETETLNALLLEIRPHHLDSVEQAQREAILRFIEVILPEQLAWKEFVEVPAQLLTPREMEILRLIAAGVSNREIAAQLYITDNTLRTHIKNTYRKLQAQSRTHAIHQAKELGILA
jgi:LuxR family maltose regulon positive regulatory protein